MTASPNQRMVLLNHLVSRSITKNRNEEEPPTHGAEELFRIIEQRFQRGWTIEFSNEDSESNENLRLVKNQGKHYWRIKEIKHQINRDKSATVILLIEYFDADRTHFHVVNPADFSGRSIAGTGLERGACTAHVCVLLPPPGRYDDGEYRCVIEVVPQITRSAIQHLLSRQIRRQCDLEEWSYEVNRVDRRGKKQTKTYRYHPRLELRADVGRNIQSAQVGRVLKNLVFTNTSAKMNTGGSTHKIHEEFTANVQIKISTKDGPKDPGLLAKWVSNIKNYHEKIGYKTRLSFGSADGSHDVGAVAGALEGATDILMCPREVVTFQTAREIWEPFVQPSVVSSLQELLNKDELWQRTEQD